MNPHHGMEGECYISEALILKYESQATSSDTCASNFVTAMKRKEAQLFEEIQKAYHRDIAECHSALHHRASDEVWEGLSPEQHEERALERQHFLELRPLSFYMMPELSVEVIKERFGSTMSSAEQLENVNKRKLALERLLNTRELQQVAVSTHLASDFCPALGKLFKLPRGFSFLKKKGMNLSVWLAQTQNTGEIVTMLLVPSEAYEFIQPGIKDFMQRRHPNTNELIVKPLILFTDDQPINHDSFKADIHTLLAQATDLRHFMGRLLELANKYSPHFKFLCQRLSRCFLRYNEADVRRQLLLLLEGCVHEDGDRKSYMKKGGIIMLGRKPDGRADMHHFKEEGESLTEQQALSSHFSLFTPLSLFTHLSLSSHFSLFTPLCSHLSLSLSLSSHTSLSLHTSLSSHLSLHLSLSLSLYLSLHRSCACCWAISTRCGAASTRAMGAASSTHRSAAACFRST